MAMVTGCFITPTSYVSPADLIFRRGTLSLRAASLAPDHAA
jgi:hypothetical protein